MVKLLAVGAGGFVGAIARFGLADAVQRWTGGGFPMGTLVVNVLGCLVIGILMALVEGRETLHPNLRLFLVIGLVGSFTTFSTFGWETYALLRGGEVGAALIYVVGSAILGLAAVVAGRAAAGSVLG